MAPQWLFDDAELRPFAAEDMASRLEAMHNSDCGYLAVAWQRGTPLPVAWLDHWQQQWPASRRYAEGRIYLGRLFRQYLQETRGAHKTASGLPRLRLVSGFNHAFRCFSFEPAAACAHLGLVALDLEKLRGELLQRALFAETAGGRA
jgi:hypothetical protein